MTFSFFAFVTMTLSSFKGLSANAQSTLYNYLLHYPILMVCPHYAVAACCFPSSVTSKF